jgi:NAD(P)H dehydrogenase (quinone)
MHVLTVLCHPNPSSFAHAIAKRFIEGARSAGHSTELADLYVEKFDPILTERDLRQFKGVAMPEDVLREQARIERCDALCLVYPIWWYGPPAMMKGWFDRVWSAGWAYEWQHDPEGSLLAARPCTMLLPMGASNNQLNRWGYRQEIEHLWRYGVLGYCGVDPIRIELLTDCAFESGVHAGYLDLAYDAGYAIERDMLARPGIRELLERP